MSDLSWWKVTFTIEVQTCTEQGKGPRDAMGKAWTEVMQKAYEDHIPDTDMIKTGVTVDPTNVEGKRLLS